MGSRTFYDRVEMLRRLGEADPTILTSFAHVLRSVQIGGRAWKTAPVDAPYTYLIGTEQDKYITRTLLPRVDDCRMLIHSIHRDDRDMHPHDHPWDEAVFLIVEGGYTDQRWFPPGSEQQRHTEVSPSSWCSFQRVLRPGDVNVLTASDYHRAIDVLPNTLTLGVVGKRVQEWGFMVDGVKIDNETYRGALSGRHT